MIKALIFDFDGVIVESVDIKTKAFAKLFKSEKHNIAKKIVNYHLQHTGISRFEKFIYIYKKILNRELPKETFEDLCQKFSKLVVDEVASAPFVKGAEEFLNTYATQYKCFVVSATPQREIKDILRRRHLSHYFIGVYGAPEKKINIVKKIIQNYKILPKEIIYVGDSFSDYEAAHNNSIAFIARINNNKHLFSRVNCLKIKNLIHLEKLLK